VITCYRECNERAVGCHGKCEKYIQQKEKSEELRLKRWEEKRVQGMYEEIKREGVMKRIRSSSGMRSWKVVGQR